MAMFPDPLQSARVWLRQTTVPLKQLHAHVIRALLLIRQGKN